MHSAHASIGLVLLYVFDDIMLVLSHVEAHHMLYIWKAVGGYVF